MTRHGTLLVFKEGTTPDQAAAALEKIREVLDLPAETTEYTQDQAATARFRAVRPTRRPFVMRDKVIEFDDEWGGPVWYIP